METASILSSKAVRLSYGGLIALYVFLTVFYLALGPIPVERFGHDVVYMLDWTSRIEQGQIPHNDFISVLGGGFLYICWFFLKMAHFGIFGFSLANAFVTSVLFLSALTMVYLAQRKKPGTVPHGLVFLLLAFILCCGYGCYLIGVTGAITYANIYNRWGYALLAVIAMHYLILKQPTVLSSLIAGFLLGSIFLIKSTFFDTGLAFVGLSVALGYERSPRNLLACAFAIIAAIGAFLIATGIDLHAMMRDYAAPLPLRYAYISDNPAWFQVKFGPTILGTGLPLAVMLFAMLRRCDLKTCLCFLGLCLLACINHAANFGFKEMPLAVIAMIYGLLALDLPRRSLALASVLVIILAGTFYVENIACLMKAAGLAGQRADYTSYDFGPFKDLYIINADDRSTNDYSGKIQEGLALIHAHAAAPEKIAALNFENPFNVALGAQAPRFQQTIWQNGMTYYGSMKPDYAPAFSDTKYVMISTAKDQDIVGLYDLYKADLDRDFDVLGMSPRWILLGRKTGAN